MSCSVFVHIKYSKELEEKIRKISGIVLKNGYRDFQSVKVPEELFPQHKKEVDAHRWVDGEDGKKLHFSTNPGKWKYEGHGFEIWLGFEGDIVFVVACHWDPDHGHFTLVDIGEWVKDNLGDIEITQEKVSY